MNLKTAIACIALLSVAYGAHVGIKVRNVDTVPELDVEKYVGRWYQVFGNRYGWLSYGDDAVCNTATYRKVDEITVDVLNHNRQDVGDGPERFITGYVTRRVEEGKFFLYLDGVPFVGNYWVIKLGPEVGPDGQYDFSVVTNADFTTLFVLTRDVARFKELYEEEVLSFLEEAGFTDYWTRPIPDFHPENCLYPPFP